jgi:hypothetical protein|tara:strand:- start:522 stop:665 length:144 start_codon:yes stop_codon:yes gene_type:complete
MSKGSKRRPEDIKKYKNNWDKIFKAKKNGTKQNTNQETRRNTDCNVW